MAYDHGPRQTLAPLATEVGFRWVSVSASGLTSIEGWVVRLESESCSGVVIGTSQSLVGHASELACAIAACRLRIPVVVIEDYPGNFQADAGAHVQLLVVESNLAAERVRSRLVNGRTGIETGATLRYDPFRAKRVSAELANNGRLTARNVLWVGQPETEATLVSLSRVLPALESIGVRCSFRAHPRDVGYSEGRYYELFRCYRVCDISSHPLSPELLDGVSLVATHFSSMAIELSFSGIPAVNVLYPDAGGACLFSVTGYNIPLHCTYGATALIEQPFDTEAILAQLLFDESVRLRRFDKFKAYFSVDEMETPKVAKLIKQFVCTYV